MAATFLNRGNCIFGNEALQRLLSRHLATDDFKATRVPLHIVATDLKRGEKVVLENGQVSTAVVASAAIPGLFCPVTRGGRQLVDGGLIADMDLDTAVRLGAEDIVAIDLTQPASSFRSGNILEVFNRSLEVLLREQVRRDIERFSHQARITVIRPQLDHAHTLASFSHISHLIEEGERLGRQLLDRCLDGEGRLTCGLITNEPES